MKFKGFTLIELLVVIAIIGLLSTLATITLADNRMKSRDTKRKADIHILRAAMIVYFDQNFKYPASNCTEMNGKWVCLSAEASGDPFWIPDLRGYMSPPPEDPGGHPDTNHDQYIYLSEGPDYKDFTLFYMTEEGPQRDLCSMGLQDLFPPDPPLVWSTVCN